MTGTESWFSGCRQIGRLWLVCIASALPFTAQAQGSCQPLTDTSVILSVVSEQFFDRRFNGLSWNAEVAQTVESVDCDESPAQVSARINALLSKLGASHTFVYSTEDIEYWAFNAQNSFDSVDAYPLPFPGIWVRREGEQWFVSAVLDGSEASAAGVQAGDRLIQLNSQEFSPTAFVAGENRLQISADGSSTRELTLNVTEQGVMRALIDASAASARIISAGNAQVGYYRIWAGRDAIQRDFQSTLDEFYDAKVDALIVDLRGGLGAIGIDYLAPVRFYQVRHKVPIHFLIDESVFGGKELVASTARSDGLATLVGTTTAGEHRPARITRVLGGRYFLSVATGSFPAPDAGVIEGAGVEPDMEVESCRQYCNGRDPVLEASLQALAAELPAD